MLSVETLRQGFAAFFGNAPATYEGCGRAWADAVGAYAASVTPPSTTVSAAAVQLGMALAGAFAQESALAAMESAFSAFGVSVGAGMAGYVPTPPPGAVGFAAAFAGPMPQTQGEAAQRMSGLIDTWMRTGTASLAVPPGTVIPWS